MIYYLFEGKSDFPLEALLVAVSFTAAFIGFKCFAKYLPKDHGREFAVNGALSQGKPRGAGIILVSVFTLCAALSTKMALEQVINLVLIYAAMMTGFLDDAAKVPWGELKKGLLDLVISAGISVNFVCHHDTVIGIFGWTTFEIPAVVYEILGTALVWGSINVVNCTDGVDGLCASLSMVTIFFMSQLTLMNKESGYVMLAVLAAYLWFNCSPSLMLMGDAGSRALGVFIAIQAMQSGHPLVFVPFAAVMIVDGGLGLVKLTVRRVTHSKTFMDGIRTPIHDHARKNKGFGDTQVVTRFTLVQLVICLITLFLF